MTKRLLIIFISFAYSCLAHENCENLQSAIDLFEQQVAQDMALNQIPGCAITVTYQSKVVYSRGFGVQDTNLLQPVTEETLFRLASNSKMFTAIAIIQIYERGLVELDEPVVKYLPWFRQKDPTNRWEKITIRQLLNHTAGISRCEGFESWSNQEDLTKGHLASSADMMENILNQEMVSEPGQRLKYSNLGYWFLSQVIAEHGGANGETSDERYVNYIRENILQPLNMSHSGFIIDQSDLNQLAIPHSPLDHAKERVALPVIFNCGGLNGGWGFYSSASDISKFLIWLSAAFQGNSMPILKPDTMALMFSHPVQDPLQTSTQYGLGINVKYDGNLVMMGHTGSFAGYKSIVMVDEKTGIGIAVFLNTGDAYNWYYWNLAYKTIGHALQSLTPELPQTPAVSTEHTSTSDLYINLHDHYKTPMFNGATFYEENGTLMMHGYGNQLSMQLLSQSPNQMDFRFGWEGGFVSYNGEKITFYLDENGNVLYALVGNTFRYYPTHNKIIDSSL